MLFFWRYGKMKKCILMLMILGLVSLSHAEMLSYTFDADTEGFTNVAWVSSGAIQETFTAAGWQQAQIKMKMIVCLGRPLRKPRQHGRWRSTIASRR